MKIATILLTDQNNAMGKNDLLLSHFPAYLKYFNDLTQNAPLIMGRKTFENIGHILKSRRNIVITRDEKYHSSKAKTFNSLEQALVNCKGEKQIFVIGGIQVFAEAAPLITEIYRTAIMARFKAELYYPEIDTSEFQLSSSECISADQENKFSYCVEKWERINSSVPASSTQAN